MKQKYIDTLLTEIQNLESEVTNLKVNQKVPFSFFKDSFKRTQEISHLLHQLEFVQIEDMKNQMEKLVHYLSDSVKSKEEVESSDIPVAVDNENSDIEVAVDNENPEDFIAAGQKVASTLSSSISEEKAKEEKVKSSIHDKAIDANPISPYLPLDSQPQEVDSPSHSAIHNKKETVVDLLSAKSQSLNDVQPANHTLLDTKRSISLNDRFLFQRELFDNNREAMNDMLIKLQSLSSFSDKEIYLKEHTDWNFKDEVVDKFIQMMKEGYR